MDNQDVIKAYREGTAWALGEPVAVDAWAAVMRAALPSDGGTYNAFDVKTMEMALKPFHNQITVQPARECSVAVYVRGERSALTAIARMAAVILDADEIDFQERLPAVAGQSRGPTVATPDVLRLWWD